MVSCYWGWVGAGLRGGGRGEVQSIDGNVTQRLVHTSVDDRVVDRVVAYCGQSGQCVMYQFDCARILE